MKFVLVLSMLLPMATFSQQVQNVKASQINDDVVVSYDLVDTKPAYVSLYYSKDGGVSFSQELRQVAGDVKANVKPGTNKKISWSVGKELVVFDGDMIFKVEAASKKIGFPKPVSDEYFSIEVINAFFEGSNVKIELKVTNISQKPVMSAHFSKSGTLVLDDQGSAFDSPEIMIANKSYSEYIEFSKDVAYKGVVILKNVNMDMSVITLLKLNFQIIYDIRHYSIRNIPISK